MGFSPPTASERLRAIGPTDGLSEPLARALDPGSAFEPIPVPGPNDWLAVHVEPGQTFAQFVRSGSHRPDGTRNKLCLQPLGVFEDGKSPSTEVLSECARAFFTLDVKLLAPLDPGTQKFTTRINRFTNKPQVLTGDVLTLLRTKLPDDAFCLLAITMEDLYPDPDWNFVFGQATLRNRVAVYSFARYDPLFYGEDRGPDYEKKLLRRSCKVLVHETAHMFGLTHCIYFKCVLNGSNHLDESDARPLRLCPVCLRKLQHSVGFDVVARYRTLHKFYNEVGLSDEASWTRQRLEWIESGDLSK
jgi:archaemetzincin